MLTLNPKPCPSEVCTLNQMREVTYYFEKMVPTILEVSRCIYLFVDCFLLFQALDLG